MLLCTRIRTEKHYCGWRGDLQAIKCTWSLGSPWLQIPLPQIRDFSREAGPFWAFLWGFMELRYGTIRLLWKFPELCVAKQVMLRRWALLAWVQMSFYPYHLSLSFCLCLYSLSSVSLSVPGVFWQFFSCPSHSFHLLSFSHYPSIIRAF